MEEGEAEAAAIAEEAVVVVVALRRVERSLRKRTYLT